jgi:TRAP-type C4-dicarboxylate transport system permease small subunit
MADLIEEQRSSSQSRGPLFYIGAAGLLLAMTVETVAVLGRHLGVPFLGALEIIQTAILLTASSAMVSATLNRAHASVTLLTDRLGPSAQRVLRGFANLLAAVFFVGLAAGTLWLAIDTWNEFEQTELMHVPLRPLRIVSFAAAAAIALIFARDMLRPDRGRK